MSEILPNEIKVMSASLRALMKAVVKQPKYKKESISKEHATELLLSEDILVAQSFCNENPKLCDSQGLWRHLFEIKFPDLYPLFREASVPFTSNKITGISAIDRTSLRKPLFWRDCYFDLHNMTPEMTAFVEDMVNGDITSTFDPLNSVAVGLQADSVDKTLHQNLSTLYNSFWTVGVVLANLEQSKMVMALGMLYVKDAHLFMPHVFFMKEVLNAKALSRLLLVEFLHVRASAKLQVNDYDTLNHLESPVKERAILYMLAHLFSIELRNIIFYSVFNGYADVLRFLVEDRKVDILPYEDDIMLLAVRNGHVEVLQVLLDEGGNPAKNENNAIVEASGYGKLEIVRLLLKDKRVDPGAGAEKNLALNFAARGGHTEILRLLINDKRVDLWDTDLIVSAASNGRTEAVRFLLEDGRFNPGVDDNSAIKYAAMYQYPEVVLLLLQDERVDPSIYDNIVVQYASKMGEMVILRHLLSDERVSSTYDSLDALEEASANGRIEAVRLLLQKVSDEEDISQALISASFYGQEEVVRLLLRDKRADPATKVNKAIRDASNRGHIDVVRLLLKDPRVDPTANNSEALRSASVNGELEIVRLLLEDGRVDPTAIKNEAIRSAKGEHPEILFLMANVPGMQSRAYYRVFDRNTLKDVARSREIEIDISMGKADVINKLTGSMQGSSGSGGERIPNKLTLKELKKLAAERKLIGRSKMRKKELIEALFPSKASKD